MGPELPLCCDLDARRLLLTGLILSSILGLLLYVLSVLGIIAGINLTSHSHHIFTRSSGEMPSILRWPVLISGIWRPALLVVTLMTSRTTGLRIYTSKPVMGAINVFLKFPTGSCSIAEYRTRYTELCLRLLFEDKFTTQTSGGFVVYYVSPGKGKVTAFKPVGAL